MRRSKPSQGIVGENFTPRVGENYREVNSVRFKLKFDTRLDRLTMNVWSAAGVVTGENRIESHHTIFVSLLKATKSSVVEIRLVGRVAIALADDPSVDTLSK